MIKATVKDSTVDVELDGQIGEIITETTMLIDAIARSANNNDDLRTKKFLSIVVDLLGRMYPDLSAACESTEEEGNGQAEL